MADRFTAVALAAVGAVVVASSVAVGVGEVQAWNREAPVRERRALVAAVLAEVVVPRIGVTPFPLDPGLVRVIASRDTLVVDSAPWEDHLTWTPEHDDLRLGITTVPLALVDGHAPLEVRKGMLITALYDQLLELAEVAKEIGETEGYPAFDGRIAILLSADVGAELLEQVVFTAGQAQFSGLELVVAGGWVGLRFTSDTRTNLAIRPEGVAVELPGGTAAFVATAEVGAVFERFFPGARVRVYSDGGTYGDLVRWSADLNRAPELVYLPTQGAPEVADARDPEAALRQACPGAAALLDDPALAGRFSVDVTYGGHQPLSLREELRDAVANTSRLRDCVVPRIPAARSPGVVTVSVDADVERVVTRVDPGPLGDAVGLTRCLQGFPARTPMGWWNPTPPAVGTATITVTIDGGGRRPAADPAHVAAVEAGEPVSTAGLVVVALAPEVSVETRGRAVAAIGRDRRALLRVMVGADLELVRLWAMAALVPIADADDLVVIAAAGVPGALFDAIAARAGEIGVEADAALSLAAALPAIQGRVIAASSRLPPGGWVEQMLTHPDDGVRRRAAGVLSARSDVGAVVAALLRALDPDAHTEPPWGAGALFLPSVDVEEPGMAELGEHLARWMVRCETACPPGQRARIQRTAFSSAAGRWIRSRDGCGWFRDPIGCMDPEYLAHIRELESR